MKLELNSKIINFVIVISCISIINSTVLKNMNQIKQNNSCENSCQVCQKTVYQLKFQQIADCNFSNTCKGTCNKIVETWGTNWSPFEPFLKDQFGKCEICFRAGYCSISECKNQEAKELDIINTIINKSTLTGKIDENLLKNLPGISSVTQKDIPHTEKINNVIIKKLDKEIKHAIKSQNSEDLVPHIQSLIKVYFTEPFEPVTQKISKIFDFQNINSSNEITFWNAEKTNKDIMKNKQKSDNLVKKLENQLKTIENAKETKDKSIKGEINKAIKVTDDTLKKVDKKFSKSEKKINKKEEKIERILKADNVDDKTKNGLKDSLKQIKEVKANIQSVKSDIKKLEAKTKSF